MKNTLEYRSPESLGIASDAIIRFLETAQKENFGLHSAILLRHGKIAMETYFKPYSADRLHGLFSLSKSFTSTAVGFAVQEGLISLNDRLIDHFPDKLPCDPCGHMKEVTVRNLLSMATGHSENPTVAFVDDWVYGFLSTFVEWKPGSRFLYNTSASHMLAAIVQKVSGKTVTEYLRERLFDPLDMNKNIFWQQSPVGVDCGGFGLNVTTRDIAKFGQFYLQRGMWDGKQLLSADWIDMATSKQIDNYGELDWGQGYGFQFWRCQPEGVYRGDGAFGQYCVVMPKQDAVFVCTASVDNMQNCLTAIWDILIPAMGEALPEDPQTEQKLLAICDTAQVAMEIGEADAKIDVNGITYAISDNPLGLYSVCAEFGETDHLLFKTKNGDLDCTVKHGAFTENRFPAAIPQGMTEKQIRSLYLERDVTGSWIAENVYRLYLFSSHCTEIDIFDLTFDTKRDLLTLRYQRQGSFQKTDFTVYGIA